MWRYVVRRFLVAIPTLVLVSIITFIIIQLPPGDYLTAFLAQLRQQGDTVSVQQVAALEERYGLNQPIYQQYWMWISGIVLRGDFGESFEWRMPVSELLWDRMLLTVVLAGSTLLFTWLLAIPIGILSAVRQYSISDHVTTFFGFLGLGIPNFLFALVLLWVAYAYFDQSVGGLFSPQYLDAAWSLGRVWDLIKHLWIPMIVLGTAGTASLIRVMRANLLDELHKPYVEAARARGLTERDLIARYPVRVALNPFVSTIGYALPELVSGATIVAIVLSLPTTGPLLLDALVAQDMYLAGSFLLMLSVLVIVGTLISDLLLVWLDPRIRLDD